MKISRLTWMLAASVGSLVGVAGAGAGVVYQTGNIQYTNVNIAAATDAFTIQGEVDSTGVFVYFDGFDASGTAIELHGQHGVAFVEPRHATDSLFRVTITAQTGWAFANVDWKNDALPPNDGLLTFSALDFQGNTIPLSSGTDTFAFSHNGQNPFHAHADAATPIWRLIIDSTVPMMDLKQVSVDLVQIPAPGALALAGLGVLTLCRRGARPA
ncbi:MAG: hypothetical protein DYG92_11190 [Leptolyngbya sp. PLA1]|nr:hypothetical protein [Leptolyngbya sp. PLA1]